MSLLQHFFTANAKFLTSFLTIPISIVTWCRPSIFLFFLILAQHCLFVSSFNRELKQRRSTHVKFLLLIVLIERLSRKFGHHIYCSAEYWPSRRMQNAQFPLTWVRLKTSFTALFTNMRTLKFKSRLHNCVFRCRQS